MHGFRRAGLLLCLFVWSWACESSVSYQPTGECADGEKTCNGDEAQRCIAGVWKVEAVCEPKTCADGVCAGPCTSGKRCFGNAPQVCNAMGQWETGASCATDEMCNAGVCTCSPGMTKCKDSTTVEQCNASGQWVNAAVCQGLCVNGQCLECTPGETRCQGQQPQACDPSQHWTNIGGPCGSSTCVQGTCIGNCAPGEKLCSGVTPLVCIDGQFVEQIPCDALGGVCMNGDCVLSDFGWVGTACSSDAECGLMGLGGICARADGDDPVFQGGPENGYCTMPCQGNGDCPGVANLCFNGLGGDAMEGRCVLSCDLGPDLMYLNDPLDSFKCHGREDVACTSTPNGNLCLPTCTNDMHCPAGRVCDLTLGICVNGILSGKKLGSGCDPNAVQDECGNGFCQIVNGMGMTGMCSGRCTLGGDIQYGDCGGLSNGLCVFIPSGNGVGDLGFCAGSCMAQDECAAPDTFCLKLSSLGGYCLPTSACPNGQADCNFPGTMCTQTKVGAFCIDPTFPLGTLAP